MGSMAEPKRRVKYSIDPNALSWVKNEDKFGQRLMEKMGWEQGKGLGAKGTGIVENIKASFKSDSKGIGYTKDNYDNVWMDHQDDFESLLSSLKNDHGGADATTTSSTTKVASLEVNSKESKSRVHYRKFTRSKDLSNLTETDFSCILSSGKRKAAAKETSDEVVEEKSVKTKVSQTVEETDLKMKLTTNTLSMHEYFAKKMKSLKKTKESEESEQQKPASPAPSEEDEEEEATPEPVEEAEEEAEVEEKASKKAKSSSKRHEETFAGSNLAELSGYIPYNITRDVDLVMKDKCKRIAGKTAKQKRQNKGV